MNKALMQKSIREGSVVFLACAIGMALFTFFRVWIVGRFDSNRFQQLIELLPKDWDRFASVDFQWMVTYVGRVAMTFDEPMLMMLATLWGIVRGSDVVSGELGRGTMEMMLGQPVRRSTIFWTHVGVTVVGALMLALLTWLTIAAAVQVTQIREYLFPEFRVPLTGLRIPLTNQEPTEQWVAMRDFVSPGVFWAGIVNMFCLMMFFAGLASFLSSCDRYRWRTLGITFGVYFVMALLKFGGMASESLRFMLYLSVFQLFEPELHVRLASEGDSRLWSLSWWNEKLSIYEFGPMGSNLLMLLLAIAMLVLGARVFGSRDLPAPV